MGLSSRFTALAETELTVPPGEKNWVEWPVALTGMADGFVRLDLEGTDELAWRFAKGILPRQVGGWGMSAKRLRRICDGATLAFRIAPGQPVYGSSTVISGITRPLQFTNLWRSDPGQSLPQWVELAWPAP